MSSRQQTLFDSLSVKRKLMVIVSIFYISLCGSLGIYLSKEKLNIDGMALVAIAFILIFNMFLPFFMLYIWELHDKLLKNQNGGGLGYE